MITKGDSVMVIAHSRGEDYLDEYIGKIGCVVAAMQPQFDDLPNYAHVEFDDGHIWYFNTKVLQVVRVFQLVESIADDLAPGNLAGLFNKVAEV